MSMFQVEKRERGTAKPKQLRKRGVLPMALVDRSHETMLIQAPVDSLREAMAHVDGHGRLEFQIEGEKKTRNAIVKHIEQDPLRHELIHVTLQEVSDGDTVKMDVPVVPTGHPEDLDSKGVTLQAVTDHLKLRGQFSSLPESIEVDISQLSVGHHISAGEVELPEGVELMTAADATLFTMTVNRANLEPETSEETEETAAGESSGESA